MYVIYILYDLKQRGSYVQIYLRMPMGLLHIPLGQTCAAAAQTILRKKEGGASSHYCSTQRWHLAKSCHPTFCRL